MSSIDRPLSGDVLRFDLRGERARVDDPELLARHGRNGRTLVKEGALRVTLVMLRAGGVIAPHRASGAITVLVLDGDIRVEAAGQEHRLGSGELLVVHGGVEHAIDSTAGGVFLLTLVQP
jgi:quercetin dioxygenase-like cupin family protein